MTEMFKGLTNFAAILKEAQQIQGRAEEMQAKLGQLRVQGSAGGGMVVVEASGLQRVLSIKIEPSLLEGSDIEMLEICWFPQPIRHWRKGLKRLRTKWRR